MQRIAILATLYLAGAEYTRNLSPSYIRHGDTHHLSFWPFFLLIDLAQPLKE